MSKVACFFLVPESKHIHRIGFDVVAIQSHIARIAEWNDQLTQFWKIVKRSADLWFCFQKRELLCNGSTCTPRRLGILLAISGFRKGCKCLMCLYYEASRSFGLCTFLGMDVQRIIHRYVPA